LTRRPEPEPAPPAVTPAGRGVQARDVVEYGAALVLAVLAAPAVLLLAALVKLTSRGPAFYAQTRLGRGGRPYRLYKLRTMAHDAEKLSGPQWSTPGGPRVTWLGRALRKSHLDELPQLWNVLKGEMALVGPRPERPEFVAVLKQAVPHYEERLLVRPGVTGLAQIQLPPDTDLESVRRKTAYDLYYLRTASLWLDLRIIFLTAFYAAGTKVFWPFRLLGMPRPEVIEGAYRERCARAPAAPAPAAPAAADIVEDIDLSPATAGGSPSSSDTLLDIDLGPQGVNGPPLPSSADTVVDIDLRNDPVRPNVLYLVHRLPYPPDKGDRIRAYHLLRFLSGRAAVHLACLADEPVPDEAVASLRRHCERVAVVRLGRRTRWATALGSLVCGGTVTEGAFRSAGLRAVLRQWAAETAFDGAVASASSMVPYLRLPEFRHVPAVIDLVDVDSQKWFDYAAASRRPLAWLYAAEGRRLRQLEGSLPSWARAVTLVSEAEADLYRAFCAPGEVRAVSNGVDLEYFRPQPRQAVEPACVFVGALDYRPNVDAACWFCQEVWPEVRRRRPGAELWLVGRKPATPVQRLAEVPGVRLVGQVPDVRPYVARAALAVVPLRIARGLQNKVLEALAMGKPVVASPQALAGLKPRTDAPALPARSPQEWVARVVRLLDDEGLRRDLGARGRAYVEEHHRWDTCLEAFEPLPCFAAPGPAARAVA
jgi:sugar transferase (PEP-CTERM/EpsH1 system associated)